MGSRGVPSAFSRFDANVSAGAPNMIRMIGRMISNTFWYFATLWLINEVIASYVAAQTGSKHINLMTELFKIIVKLLAPQ